MTPFGELTTLTSVYVNDSLIEVENITSAFEIDLSGLKMDIGTAVKIDIYHRPDCFPKVIYNPPPRQKVEFLNIEIVD